jgi:thiol-disulfide isomerase/thioredoxin
MIIKVLIAVVIAFIIYMIYKQATESLSNRTYLVVNYSSSRCPHCITMKPIWEAVIDSVLSNSSGEYQFNYIDVDQTPVPGIHATPTILKTRSDGMVTKYPGKPDFAALKAWVLQDSSEHLSVPTGAVPTYREARNVYRQIENLSARKAEGFIFPATFADAKKMYFGEQLSVPDYTEARNIYRQIEGFETLNSAMTVEYHYSDSCGYCRVFTPIWNDLTNLQAKVPNLRMHAINEDETPTPGVTGVPTIVMIDYTGHTYKYGGELSYDAVEAWIMGRYNGTISDKYQITRY